MVIVLFGLMILFAFFEFSRSLILSGIHAREPLETETAQLVEWGLLNLSIIFSLILSLGR